MFYRTQIKSVTRDGVIDVQGKSLKFIGYLRVKAGDNVFTDGKFIFGNVPPKGTPAIFDEPSGIPVLSDDLQGYFSNRGFFKRYKVAGDEWIVNDEKNYVHDDGEENIIDAEFSDDGAVYTVEKKVIDSGGADSDFFYSEFRGRYRHYLNPISETDPFLRFSFNKEYLWDLNNNFGQGRILREFKFNYLNFDSAEYARLDDTVFKDIELKIKKDGEETQTVTLSFLLKKIEDEIAKNVNFIQVPGENPIDRIRTRAKVLNFKIKPDGTWDALFECRIFALREFLYKWMIESDDIVYESSAAHDFCLFKVNSAGEYTHLADSFFVYPLYLSKVVEETATAENTDPRLSRWTYNGKYFTEDVYDSRFMPNAPAYSDYDNGQRVETYTKKIAQEFSFSVQDDFQAKLKNLGEDIKWQLDGVYDCTGNKIFGNVSADTDAHKWNMSIVPLKDGSYLFGIHDGKLYKIRDGTFEQVGDGLKNFRLRELKRISKARK